MSESGEIYYPVSRPPVNPSIKMRKASKEHYSASAMRARKQPNTSDVANQHNQRKIIIGKYLDTDMGDVERSFSLNNINKIESLQNNRSLSASNLYALTDPNLSLKEAVSKKVYDKPNTSFAKEKALFTAYTQKYFHQLTVGCGNEKCNNKFCKSAKNHKQFNAGMAALLSIELSSYKSQYLCKKESSKQNARILDEKIFIDKNNKIHQKDNNELTDDEDNAVPFLYSFYSTSPFRSLFLPCPLVSSGLGIHKTHSYSELPVTTAEKDLTITSMITSTVKSHLNSLATTVSASLSNIWKPSTFETKNEDRLDHNSNNNETRTRNKIVKQDNIDNSSDDEDNKGTDETDGDIQKITTRMRLPSVRMFGSENAVDIDCDVEDIDEFETSVAKEFSIDIIEPDPFLDDEEEEEEEEEEEVVVSDENEDFVDGYSLTHLTLDMFNSVVDNYNDCKDTTFLINTIRTVFSSWESLNMSFCNEGIIKYGVYPFNLKIKDVQRVFQTIMYMEISDVLIGVVMDTIKVMLLSKKFTINEPSDLKPIVILLEIPWLFEHDQTALLITGIISELSMLCKESISLYLSDLPKIKFRNLLMGFKCLLDGQPLWNIASTKNSAATISLFKTLEVMYVANNLHGDFQLILPNTDFYDKQLTSRIDFKLEYSYWEKMTSGELNDIDSILNYPFLLEPSIKVQVIHIDAITQMREEYQDAIVHQARIQQVQKSWSDFNDSSSLSLEVRAAMCPYLLLEIHRENFIEDTLKQLEAKSADLKKPLKIKYTNGGEQGLDMGGLQKEFFQVIIEAMFDPNYSLFTTSEDNSFVWFNTFTFESNVMYELVGILLGLAIYNGIILDVHFPLLVYKKLLGYKIGLPDLREIQPTLCNGLEQLLVYDGDVENDYGLTFDVSHTMYGKELRMELIPNGKDIPVTSANRVHFVDLYVEFLLNTSVKDQFEAFQNGFLQVCKGPTMKLCTPPELELLICGSPDLDFKALEEVTEYKDGFSKNHALIMEFWEIVHSFNQSQKKSLLMFVTGSYRVPLRGLGSMSFYIQRNGPDSNNLPTSMTCFNRLLLPEYKSAAKLKSMLLLAIENAKGFGLT